MQSDSYLFVPLPQSPCSSSCRLNTLSTFPLRASAPALPTWNAFAPDLCMPGAFPPFGGGSNAAFAGRPSLHLV